MSAYLVSANTLNMIHTFITDDAIFQQVLHGSCRHILQRIGYDLSGKRELSVEMSRLFADMVQLNEASVNARYPSQPCNASVLRCTPVDYPSRMQVLKNLQCYLYQCSTDDCAETPLYDALEKIAVSLMREIVESLPAYQVAEWGTE